MSHIHTKPGQHDFTASAFIFLIDGPEPRVLLHLHKRLDFLMHFGGHVELDENPWQAVVREIHEESGYVISQLRLLQPKNRLKKVSFGVLVPYPICVLSVGYKNYEDGEHTHDDLCFAFVTKERAKNKTPHNESDDIRLFTRDQLANLSNDEVLADIREAGLFVFDECLKNWEQIQAEEI